MKHLMILAAISAAMLLGCKDKTAGSGQINKELATDTPAEQGGADEKNVETPPPGGSAANDAFMNELDEDKLKETESGLKYQIIEEGSGNVPEKGQTVVAHYHGTTMDGQEFDSSYERGEPFNFPLGQGRVIKGWDEFFGMVPVGTKAIIILPPDLAYGAQGSPPKIPPSATLRFDVELLGIQ
ncbi:MAG: FKBP-type peptidyl-prolyl cis-trans isomerase [Bacteroidota bacterium]